MEILKKYRLIISLLGVFLFAIYGMIFYLFGSHGASAAGVGLLAVLISINSPRMLERRNKILKYENILKSHGVDPRDSYSLFPASSYAWIDESIYSQRIFELSMHARSVIEKKTRTLKIQDLEEALISLGESVVSYFEENMTSEQDYDRRESELILRIMYSLIEKTIKDHLKVLSRKKKQLIYFDDYGREVTSKWNREITYFVRNVLFPLDLSPVEDLREELEENKTFQLNSNVSQKEMCESWVSYVNTIIDIYSDCSDPEIDRTENDLSLMTGHEYEEFVCSIFYTHGWDAKITKGSGDHGADVLAEKDGLRIAIQCKLYSSPVGNKSVQEAFSAKGFYDCDLACVVTNSTFTPSARQAAYKLGVSLLHHNEIPEYLLGHCFG